VAHPLHTESVHVSTESKGTDFMDVLRVIDSLFSGVMAAGADAWSASFGRGEATRAGLMMATCPECNGSIGHDWRLCPHCGFRLTDGY
jgi:hypothetical protein